MEFDFTYYKTSTKDQLFNLPAPTGSSYARYYVNAGEIQNLSLIHIFQQVKVAKEGLLKEREEEKVKLEAQEKEQKLLVANLKRCV